MVAPTLKNSEVQMTAAGGDQERYIILLDRKRMMDRLQGLAHIPYENERIM